MAKIPSWPYSICGRKDSPAIVFLHGFLGSRLDWNQVVDKISDEFYCIVPDLPGHGDNIPNELVSYLDFDILTDGLIHLMDQVGIHRANLVGYSMGGRVGLYTVVNYPERFESLVVESASPGISDPDERDERLRLDRERADDILHLGMDVFIEGWYRMDVFSSLRHSQEFQTMIERRKKNHPEWCARIIQDLSPGKQPSLWGALGTISVPVLFVAGGLDAKYARLAETVQQVNPRLEVSLIYDGGHNLHLEKPVQFTELIRHFLGQHAHFVNAP